jgi:hypothetical protein
MQLARTALAHAHGKATSAELAAAKTEFAISRLMDHITALLTPCAPLSATQTQDLHWLIDRYAQPVKVPQPSSEGS